ncbi:complex I NDUFA9 subunit family protein [Azoarcus sp. L1K30]|uniref:complex I NDUFA9 subunit family protein n=1 Tax=Azoarcus sp. L1K30 TaxID=2820277 RepID=UPI001B8130E1|nr:complex I NDUFA9 subunit family protein [Azoarcus sp. L1K30]MBR0566456.1 complex I NDUFA9 subunit family protein [Azoarcus sp. L1K30]
MSPQRVVLIGGAGFIGSAIANRLAEAGISVLIPTRRRSRAGQVLLLPNVEVIETDCHDESVLNELFEDADAVVNLVGILHSRSGSPYGPDFARAHVELPTRIVAACKASGVGQLIHVSALGADAAAPSEYQRSKAAGEQAVRAATPEVAWTILRPSVVFGRDDGFLNLFARLAGVLPIIPLGGASARFQPVYVEDVAEVVWHCLNDSAAARDQTFELAGPTVYTLRQLVEYVSALVGHPRPVIPLPEGLAMLQAGLMELAPRPLMSRDNVRSMRADNIATAAPLPFGLRPTAIEAVVPGWLGPAGNQRARYNPMRRHARR